MRSASENRKPAASAQHSPRQNHLIAALPPGDYERLLPDLEPVRLPLGWAVHRSGEVEKYLYFPTTGIVSKFYMTESGASAGFAVTGSEGMIGIASILSSERTRTNAVVLSAGHAYRLATDLVKTEFKFGHPVRQLLMRYTQALITQVAQTAVCNRHHSVDQQLCRWLLMCLDRLPGNEMPMTHEVISSMLGVRREGVSAAAGKLQEEGLIHCGRGRIIVLDRPKLERRACECYGVVIREYARLVSGMSSTHDHHQRTEQCRPLRLEGKEHDCRTFAQKSSGGAQLSACGQE
jgi:CRP-like cAMP-binding protein